jgi:flagellar biosynthetic protein FliR
MGAAELAALPGWAFAFVLVLCRCGSAVMLLPGLGEAEPPATLRVGLALGLVALVLPSVGAIDQPDGWRAAAMVAGELLCGGVLGWLARCIALALPMAGQIISFMLGLSSVVAADPVLGQSSALMRLFALAAPVLVLATGLWALPVTALANSYSLVPPGALLPVADGLQALLDAVVTAVGLALRLAAPFVAANVVWQAGLGLIARLIPQLQVYFVAIPGQIVGGVALFAILATGLVEAWLDTARTSFAALPGL